MNRQGLRNALVCSILSLSACAPDALDDASLASSEQALAGCATPALGTASSCALANGTLRFQVTLPSGQAYVEVFARQNGIQNVAANIVNSAAVHADGSTTYALERTGYAADDDVEFRFYSYRPASPGVFTPGAYSSAWLTHSASTVSEAVLPVTKDASLIYSSYGTGPTPGQNFGSASSVDVGSYHHDSRALFGYSLAGLAGAVGVTRAELVIPGLWAPGGNIGRFTLAVVTNSTAWQESTVTWNSTPASTVFGEFSVDTTAVNRLDVTELVDEAVANGATEISFLLEDIQNNVFIDSKEKVGGQPTYLDVEFE